MMDIDQEILNELARVETEHSWLHPWMEIPSDWLSLWDEAEWELSKWITAQVKEQAPELTEQQTEWCARIIRESIFTYLERDAIEKVTYEDPYRYHTLVVADTGTEAAMLGAHSAMIDDVDAEETADRLLEMMKSGELQADFEKTVFRD